MTLVSEFGRKNEGGHVKKISHCRACGSKALTPAFSLPATGANGFLNPFASRRDVEFVFCDPSRDGSACGLLQSAHDVDHTIAGEPSGIYAATRNHLRAIATESLELISGRDCAALDIGCSDGALLSFYPRWVDRYGVDTAEIVDGIGEWAWTARAAFPSADLDRAFGGKKFDIITAVSVLEASDEPRAFFECVKSLLSDDGVFALETLYAPLTLTRTCVEAFIGGASAVYSLAVLERLVRDCGLKVFRGALTDKEGGSVRLYITHADANDHDFDPWYERLARLWDEENALALRSQQPYQAFERRARQTHEALRAMLGEITGNGETIHLLGSGPQSAALVAWAGDAAKSIKAVVAESGERIAGLPVISETESRAAEPDYLLAPAALKREMLERWRESILLGAQIIFAGPEPHVVHTRNYAAELAKVIATGDGAGGVETLRAILGAAGRPRVVAGNSAARAAS